MQQHTEHRRWIFSLVVFIIALTVATPVLADFLGPNRTVTETTTVCKVFLKECEYSTTKEEWRYKSVDSWSCSLESKPWQEYSSNKRPCNDNLHTNGYQYWERDDVTQTETVTYPPATITSSLQNCTLRNGWCVTAAQLFLTGLEPVPGYNIFAVEGTLNGQNFACTSSTCSVSLNQGNNNFSYWALSSFLDSSEMGTLTAKVDSQLPNITANLTGTAGLNNWYLGSVTFNNSASDATSGLASFTCTRDGTTLGSCNAITVSGDGPHSVVLTAVDNAGHTRTLTQNTPIDTKNPVLNASLSGTQGSNTWYTTAVLNASATDPSPGSGLSAIQYKYDGSGWTAFPASGTLALTDGKHTVDLHAVDKAGRTVSSSKSFWLDTNAPDANLDANGTFGLNDWYIASPILTASASDGTSGLDILEYSINGGAWTTYATPFNLSDGIHTVSLWAQDQAGLVTQVDRIYQVDTRLPEIAGNLSGIPGANDWFISEVTVSASASDPMPGSDVDSFTYILGDNVETPYTAPLTLLDGQYALQLIARDRAGLSYSIQQTLKVDTTQPSLTVDSPLPNWIKDTFTFTGTAGDGNSGLFALEISTNGGQTWQTVTGIEPWNFTWNMADKSSGRYDVWIRAVDQAGLTSQQTINIGVDNTPPAISLPNSWLQWDTVTLNIQDEHSGLSEARVEISDPKGRWPARVIQLDPTQFPLAFKWDRRFSDNTIAEAGTYNIRVFALDRLGNIIEKNASIHVLLDILPPGPTSTTQPLTPSIPAQTATSIYTAITTSSPAIPTNIVTSTSSPAISGNVATSTPSPRATQVVIRPFGTIQPTAHATSTLATSPTPRTAPTQSSAVDWLQSIFEPDSNKQSTTQVESPGDSDGIPVSKTNSVLWGTAAAAAIGAAAAYAQEERRKWEEEIARQKELEEQKEERRKKMKERKTAKAEAKRAQEEAWEAARQEQLSQSVGFHNDAKIARQEYEEGLANPIRPTSSHATNIAQASAVSQARRAERKDELVQEEINAYSAEAQDWRADFDAYMAQQALLEKEKQKQAATAATSQPKKKSWWDKAIDWVDNNQQEVALGVGILAGVVAVVLSGGIAAPAVIAAWMGGAALAAGGTVALGTIALNNHYDRPWNENLLRNVAIAGGTAAAVTGLGFVYNAISIVSGSYCAIHPSTCSHIEPVFNALDTVEELWLQAQLGYQTWSGDLNGAANTALELYQEHFDGGMPGNSVARELGEELADLGEDAASIIAKYGDDVLPLLVKHGDDALEIIQKYGDDGIALLQKYGDEAVGLINSYGEYAVKIMNAVDPTAAKKLLRSLDDDVLDYVSEQGPEAVDALSRWSDADLRAHGPELALRAEKDANVLADIKKLTSLGPIDPKHLTTEQQALIDAIAANSTQYTEEGQVVLGKWVDYSNGFVQTAQNTGSVHYNPHPDMWNMLGELGDTRDEVAWLVNKQVIQNGINKGLPFEYTLNGVPADKLGNESAAIRAIFSGKSDTEVMQILKSDYLPIRMKELQELKKAGYQFTFDNASKSFILVRN